MTIFGSSTSLRRGHALQSEILGEDNAAHVHGVAGFAAGIFFSLTLMPNVDIISLHNVWLHIVGGSDRGWESVPSPTP